MRGRILGALVLLVAVVAVSRADDRPLDRTELDKRVVKAVYEAALKGTDIFNKGKHEECLRYYEGVLLGIQPMLDHRPKLMDSVKGKMDKAKGLKTADAAFALREALDDIQNEIAPGKAEVGKGDTKTMSLWDRLGGEKAVRGVVKDFVAAASEDKKVNITRDGKFKLDSKGVEQIENLLVELISETTGGPLKYTGKRTMKEVHAGMKITDEEFDALMALLQKTLEKHKVEKREADDLMKIVNSTRAVIVEVKGKGM